MNGVTVATFNTVEYAEPLREQLERAGIHAEIHHEAVMERLWLITKPLASVHVKVSPEKYAEARNLINIWDTESGVMHNAVRCPECGSSRIQYPQETHKFILPNLLGSVLSNMGMIEKEFYCEDCQYTWPRTGYRSSRARPHQAPYYFLEGVVHPAPEKQEGDVHQQAASREEHEQHHGE